MLVLARKINDTVIIGDDIEVVVIDVKGDQVKLGVKAPRSLSVHRGEIYQEIQEQNEKAAASSGSSDALEKIGKLFHHKK